MDGERPGLQGDTHHSSSLLGTRGPPIYIYIWLPDGLSVHRGGSLLAADTPGCKYFSSLDYNYKTKCSLKPVTSGLLSLKGHISNRGDLLLTVGAIFVRDSALKLMQLFI